MLHRISALVRDEDGATAIEYGLIAALVAVVIIASLNQFGAAMTTMYENITNTVLAASS
jgi:pilus assembly protein Flp/PilA